MSNKSIRTPEQQKYRDNLAKKLKWLRQQWEDWVKVAKDLYETLQDDKKYIESKWSSLDKIFDDMENSFGRKEIFMTNALLIYKELQKNKTELTEKQKEIIKRIIRFWFDEYHQEFYVRASGSIMNNYNGSLTVLWNNVAVSFLRQNFEMFSQEEKEEFILKAIKKIDFSQNSYYLENHVMRWDMEWFPREYDIVDTYHRKPSGIWSNWTDYYFSSKWSIRSMVENALANSSNEKFIFDMLPYLSAKKTFFNIPENCKAVYSDEEKFKNYIASINSLLDEKRRQNAEDQEKWRYWCLDEDRYTDVRTHNIFQFFDELWITITWNIADLLWDKPYYVGYSNGIKLIKEVSEKVIQEESVKTSLNAMMENFKKEGLEKFRKYFSSEYIWELLDDKYKMPGFVNNHIDDLEPILDQGWLSRLLKDFSELSRWKILSDSEKFHRDVFKKDVNFCFWLEPSKERLDKIWKYTDLTTLEEKDFEYASHWLYNFMEKEWLLGTDYLDEVLKWHWYPKTHSVYYMLKAKWGAQKDFLEEVLNNGWYWNEILSSEEATAFMQDIYATQDENLVKKLFKQIWKFSEYCTQEEVNILIRKMIKAVSSLGDFKQFREALNQYTYGDKFGLFLKIKYLLTNELDKYKIHDRETKIPSDIYSSIVASGIIDISRDSLPKVWQSVFVDSEDLAKLSEFYGMLLDEQKQENEKRQKEEDERKERLRKEKEEKEKIYNDALQNWDKWEVVFDDYVRDSIFHGQKYVLSVDRENCILKFISAPMWKYPYHANLHNWYIREWRCLWGGYLDKDDDRKVISLWWGSESYGCVSRKEWDAMKKMLEAKFPGYQIRG